VINPILNSEFGICRTRSLCTHYSEKKEFGSKFYKDFLEGKFKARFKSLIDIYPVSNETLKGVDERSLRVLSKFPFQIVTNLDLVQKSSVHFRGWLLRKPKPSK